MFDLIVEMFWDLMTNARWFRRGIVILIAALLFAGGAGGNWWIALVLLLAVLEAFDYLTRTRRTR